LETIKTWLDEQCEEIETYFKKKITDLAYRKTIKNRDGKLVINDIQITYSWKEYFEELHNGEKLNDFEIKEELTTMTILRSEFEVALSELKPNKASGVDYTQAELLQNSNKIVKDAMYDLIRDIYEN